MRSGIGHGVRGGVGTSCAVTSRGRIARVLAAVLVGVVGEVVVVGALSIVIGFGILKQQINVKLV